MSLTPAVCLLGILLHGGLSAVPDPPPHARTVAQVEFVGNRRVPDSLLLSKVRTRPGEPFSEADLDQDVKRLTKLGKFLPISARWEELPGQPDQIKVTFFVRDREEVRWVRFSGREAISQDDLEDLLQTRKESLLSDYFVRLDEESIRKKYLQEGYLFATLSHEVKPLSTGVGVRFIIDEGPRVKVEEIQFEGNDRIEASDLKARMQTKERSLWGIIEPGIFRQEIFDDDLEAVRRYCRSLGYLDAEVYLTSMEFGDDREWMTLKIRIVERERFVVSDIRFVEVRLDERGRESRLEGIRTGPYSESYLRTQLILREGEPILGDWLRRDTETIQRIYQKASYIRAIVRPRVDPERTGPRVRVVYEVRPSFETTVGKIKVKGNGKTKNKVIRREMGFYPGDPFDIEELENSYSRLLRKRYFKTVDLRLAPNEDDPTVEDVVVEVEEMRTGSLLIGGGIASTIGFFGNFQLIQTNFDITDAPTSWRNIAEGDFFQGGGQTLRLVAQPGRQRSVYRAHFREPYLFDLPLILGLDIYFRDRDRFDYTEGRVGGAVSLGHQLNPTSRVEMRYRREDVFITDVESDAPSDVFEVEGKNRLGSVTASYGFDNRLVDRQIVFHTGGKVFTSYEIASQLFGSEFTFNKFRVDGEYLINLYEIPAWGKIVLKTWAGFGWVGEAGSTDGVPIFERFFLGGPPNMRGFEYREVGPSEGGDPIGGTIMTVEGAEIQFPILQDVIRGHFFVDTGNIAEDINFFTINEHRIAVGVGVRIKVPVFPAPVELDFGFPIRKEPGDERRTFSFFIGFPF